MMKRRTERSTRHHEAIRPSRRSPESKLKKLSAIGEHELRKNARLLERTPLFSKTSKYSKSSPQSRSTSPWRSRAERDDAQSVSVTSLNDDDCISVCTETPSLDTGFSDLKKLALSGINKERGMEQGVRTFNGKRSVSPDNSESTMNLLRDAESVITSENRDDMSSYTPLKASIDKSRGVQIKNETRQIEEKRPLDDDTYMSDEDMKGSLISGFSFSTLGIGGASVACDQTRENSRAAREDLEELLRSAEDDKRKDEDTSIGDYESQVSEYRPIGDFENTQRGMSDRTAQLFASEESASSSNTKSSSNTYSTRSSIFRNVTRKSSRKDDTDELSDTSSFLPKHNWTAGKSRASPQHVTSSDKIRFRQDSGDENSEVASSFANRLGRQRLSKYDTADEEVGYQILGKYKDSGSCTESQDYQSFDASLESMNDGSLGRVRNNRNKVGKINFRDMSRGDVDQDSQSSEFLIKTRIGNETVLSSHGYNNDMSEIKSWDRANERYERERTNNESFTIGIENRKVDSKVYDIMSRMNNLAHGKHYEEADSIGNTRSVENKNSFEGTHCSESSFQQEMVKFRQKWNIGGDTSENSQCDDSDLDYEEAETTRDSGEKPNNHHSVRETVPRRRLDDVLNKSRKSTNTFDEDDESQMSDVKDTKRDITPNKSDLSEESDDEDSIDKEKHMMVDIGERENGDDKIWPREKKLAGNTRAVELLRDQYEDEIETRDDQILILERELSSLRQSSKEYKDRLENFEQNFVPVSKTEILEKTIAMKDIEINAIRNELDKYTGEKCNRIACSSMEVKLREASEQIEMLRNQCSDLEEYRAKLNLSTSKISSLERALTIKGHAMSSLEVEICELANGGDHSTKDEKNEETILKLAEQQYELKSLRDELEKSLTENADLVDKIGSRASEIEQLDQVQVKLAASEVQIIGLKEDKVQLEQEIHDLNTKLTKKNVEQNVIEQDLRCMINELETEAEKRRESNVKLRDSEESAARLENDVQHYEKEFSALKKEVSDLKQNLEEKETFLQDKTSSINSLKQESTLKQEELVRLETDIKQKSIDHEEEKKRLKDNYEERLNETKLLVDKVEKTVSRKDRRIKSLKKEVDYLKKDLDFDSLQHNQALERSTEDLKEKISKISHEKTSLQKELRSLKKDLKQMDKRIENDRKNSREKNHTLQKEVENKKQAEKILKRTVSCLKEELAELASSMRGKIVVDQSEIERMDDELCNARRVLSKESDARRIFTQHDDLVKSNSALKELVAVMRDKLEKKHQTAEKVNELEETISKLENEKERREADFRNKEEAYNQKISKLRKDVAEKTKKKDNIEKQLKENSKLLSRAESIMARTNEATLNAVMEALHKNEKKA